MRKIDTFILIFGLIAAFAWVIISSKDGFKGGDATIVARSITISATIDGQVENNPPIVGDWVDSEDLLVRIHNGRLDRSRLVEYESSIAFLISEIDNVSAQLESLSILREEFKQHVEIFNRWSLADQKLERLELTAQLDVAKARKRLQLKEVGRANLLYEKQLISEMDMQIATTQAEIADTEVNLNLAQLQRNGLMLQTIEESGMVFDKGDASYWTKMVDSLAVREFDNRNKMLQLEAQLKQLKPQAEAELQRINSSFKEEHRAPFTGKINTLFVTKGTRVTSGTNLLQILDCSNPVVIIPIPDNRISDFSVGSDVTVYPIDSEQALEGVISYISSGPMIGNDTSILIQQELTRDGNRAVVSLRKNTPLNLTSQSCETARRAVVVIHTDSIFKAFYDWF